VPRSSLTNRAIRARPIRVSTERGRAGFAIYRGRQKTMSDQEPFANVSEDVPLACAPLGGVPRAVLAGVLWTRANITKLGIAQIQDPKRRTYKIGKRTFRPGVVEVDPRPRWKEELKVGVSVDEIRKRSERPRRERLVTQVVGGEALWTGFNRLDHDVVTAELVAQGYSSYRPTRSPTSSTVRSFASRLRSPRRLLRSSSYSSFRSNPRTRRPGPSF
jgi:hypothetical protein